MHVSCILVCSNRTPAIGYFLRERSIFLKVQDWMGQVHVARALCFTVKWWEGQSARCRRNKQGNNLPRNTNSGPDRRKLTQSLKHQHSPVKTTLTLSEGGILMTLHPLRVPLPFEATGLYLTAALSSLSESTCASQSYRDSGGVVLRLQVCDIVLHNIGHYYNLH